MDQLLHSQREQQNDDLRGNIDFSGRHVTIISCEERLQVFHAPQNQPMPVAAALLPADQPIDLLRIAERVISKSINVPFFRVYLEAVHLTIQGTDRHALSGGSVEGGQPASGFFDLACPGATQSL